MLPFGHTAVGYLIAKSSRQKLTIKETWLVIAATNIFDLDFLVLTILGIPGSRHHYYPGHTLLMGLIYFLIIYLFFRAKVRRKTFLLVALALLSHLVLDNLDPVPQINWFYPLILKSQPAALLTNSQVLNNYLQTKLFYLEIVSVVAAVIFYRRGKINVR